MTTRLFKTMDSVFWSVTIEAIKGVAFNRPLANLKMDSGLSLVAGDDHYGGDFARGEMRAVVAKASEIDRDQSQRVGFPASAADDDGGLGKRRLWAIWIGLWRP